jgi:DNA-binding PadR family transcriptional regulator
MKSGRKRRYYAITVTGLAELENHRARWQELFEAMIGLGLVTPVSEG